MWGHVLLFRITLLVFVGPGPLHEIAFSAFSRSPLGRAERFHSYIFPQLPVLRTSRKASPLSPHFSALAFPFLLFFILLLSCTHQTALQAVPLLGLPLTPSIFFRLRYPILFQLSPFCYFLPYSPISYEGGGAYSFVACLGNSTIDHASLPRRSPIPTPSRDTFSTWALITLLPYTPSKLFDYYIPVLFRRLRLPSIA